MKLLNRTLIIIQVLLLSCCSAKKENSVPKMDKISKLFQIVEDKMGAHYVYLDKNRIFEDPIGRAEYFFKTVKTVAPQLLINTKLYKDEILNVLTDKTFRKNAFTDDDIAYILYNLPIDDYADLLSSVVPLYKNGDINQYIFELFIFQDYIVSISIYKNYNNGRLQVFLNKLLKDNDLIIKAELKNKRFREDILNLKSGASWKADENEFGIKEISRIQTPVLDTLKIEH